MELQFSLRRDLVNKRVPERNTNTSNLSLNLICERNVNVERVISRSIEKR